MLRSLLKVQIAFGFLVASVVSDPDLGLVGHEFTLAHFKKPDCEEHQETGFIPFVYRIKKNYCFTRYDFLNDKLGLGDWTGSFKIQFGADDRAISKLTYDDDSCSGTPKITPGFCVRNMDGDGYIGVLKPQLIRGQVLNKVVDTSGYYFQKYNQHGQRPQYTPELKFEPDDVDWAGWLSIDDTQYPYSFPMGGKITFTATSCGGNPVAYFVFEKAQYFSDTFPGNEPSYTTPSVVIHPETTEYSLELDPTYYTYQVANSRRREYRTLIVKLKTKGTCVRLTNLKVEMYGAKNPPSFPDFVLTPQRLCASTPGAYSTYGLFLAFSFLLSPDIQTQASACKTPATPPDEIYRIWNTIYSKTFLAKLVEWDRLSTVEQTYMCTANEFASTWTFAFSSGFNGAAGYFLFLAQYYSDLATRSICSRGDDPYLCNTQTLKTAWIATAVKIQNEITSYHKNGCDDPFKNPNYKNTTLGTQLQSLNDDFIDAVKENEYSYVAIDVMDRTDAFLNGGNVFGPSIVIAAYELAGEGSRHKTDLYEFPFDDCMRIYKADVQEAITWSKMGPRGTPSLYPPLSAETDFLPYADRSLANCSADYSFLTAFPPDSNPAGLWLYRPCAANVKWCLPRWFHDTLLVSLRGVTVERGFEGIAPITFGKLRNGQSIMALALESTGDGMVSVTEKRVLVPNTNVNSTFPIFATGYGETKGGFTPISIVQTESGKLFMLSTVGSSGVFSITYDSGLLGKRGFLTSDGIAISFASEPIPDFDFYVATGSFVRRMTTITVDYEEWILTASRDGIVGALRLGGVGGYQIVEAFPLVKDLYVAHDLLVHNGDLFVSTASDNFKPKSGAILRVPGIAASIRARKTLTDIDALVFETEYIPLRQTYPYHDISMSADGRNMYVAYGSRTLVSGDGGVISINMETKDVNVLATGLHNPSSCTNIPRSNQVICGETAGGKSIIKNTIGSLDSLVQMNDDNWNQNVPADDRYVDQLEECPKLVKKKDCKDLYTFDNNNTYKIIIQPESPLYVICPESCAKVFRTPTFRPQLSAKPLDAECPGVKPVVSTGPSSVSPPIPMGPSEGSGAQLEGDVFTFPSSAEPWAGFVNTDASVYPFKFENPGTVTFTGSIPAGGKDVMVRFRFEKNPYPDVDPAYDTAPVMVSGSEAKEYTVEVPSQGSKTFSSFIVYVVDRDSPVEMTNIRVTYDSRGQPAETPVLPFVPVKTGGAQKKGDVFWFPLGAVNSGFVNDDRSVYPFIFSKNGSLAFVASIPEGATKDCTIRFRLEANVYPNNEPSYETADITVSGPEEKAYKIVIPSQGGKTFRSLVMMVLTKEAPVKVTNVVVTRDALGVARVHWRMNDEYYDVRDPHLWWWTNSGQVNWSGDLLPATGVDNCGFTYWDIYALPDTGLLIASKDGAKKYTNYAPFADFQVNDGDILMSNFNFTNTDQNNIWIAAYVDASICPDYGKATLTLQVYHWPEEVGVLLIGPEDTTRIVSLETYRFTMEEPDTLVVCLDKPGEYTLVFEDSYGDGWNNGLPTGSECLPLQACIDLQQEWRDNGEQGEIPKCYCGYEATLKDVKGNVVFTDDGKDGGGFYKGYRYQTTLTVAEDLSVTASPFQLLSDTALNTLMTLSTLFEPSKLSKMRKAVMERAETGQKLKAKYDAKKMNALRKPRI